MNISTSSRLFKLHSIFLFFELTGLVINLIEIGFDLIRLLIFMCFIKYNDLLF